MPTARNTPVSTSRKKPTKAASSRGGAKGAPKGAARAGRGGSENTPPISSTIKGKVRTSTTNLQPTKKATGKTQQDVKPKGVHRGTDGWEAKSHQIMEAALDILVERGYGDMAMDEVSVAAKVSKRTLYEHFPSKLELALACIRSLPDWGGWGDGRDSLQERFTRSAYVGATFNHRLPAIFATAFVHRDTEPELLRVLTEEVIANRISSAEQFIALGEKLGDVHPGVSPEALTAMIIGLLMFHGAGIVDLGSGHKQAERFAEYALPMIEA